MHIINIKVYNPDTGKRIRIIPPLPLVMLPFVLKMGKLFSKVPTKKLSNNVGENIIDNKNNDRHNAKFSSVNLSLKEIDLMVKELKAYAPIELVNVKRNGKPLVTISIT